jgi:hypothetical protein
MIVFGGARGGKWQGGIAISDVPRDVIDVPVLTEVQRIEAAEAKRDRKRARRLAGDR